MAGYECSDKLNAFGNRVDLLALTGHLEMIHQDYRNLELFGIRTVREGIRWSQVERSPCSYHWEPVWAAQRAARECGIQQIWDLCHFGFPDDLTPLHPMFARRFAGLARQFVRAIRKQDPDGLLIVTPINEVGFLSWLGGEACGTSPYCTRQGWEVKYALMRAYIEATKALRQEDPRIRILSTEPLVSITPKPGATEAEKHLAWQNHNNQYQAMDILTGRICPELGGEPGLVDYAGVNYYYNNQWIDSTRETLGWNDQSLHPHWKPLASLLAEVAARYQVPLVISETSHPTEDRPVWITSIAKECRAAMEQGVPVLGICWYPAIDRPDWDHLHVWHRSGIWDHALDAEGKPVRVLHEPSAAALHDAQQLLAPLIS